jgi:hypothetical protein
MAELAKRHKTEVMIMLYDGAPCHSQTALEVPDNLALEKLPPYSPTRYPTEAMK